MAQILAGIKHLVVVALENRSLDNMLGTLHTDGTAPSVVLPAGSATSFDGLRPDLANPANPGFFDGGPPPSGRRTLVVYLHGLLATTPGFQWLQQRAMALHAKEHPDDPPR